MSETKNPLPAGRILMASLILLAGAVIFYFIRTSGSEEAGISGQAKAGGNSPAVSGARQNDEGSHDNKAPAKRSEKQDVLPFMQDYYRDLSGDHFVAEKYFSDHIIQYIGLKNTNPAAINNVYATNKEYLNARSTIINNEITPTREDGGVSYHTYWIDFSCYRSSLNKNQRCKVKIELGLDEAGKITVYREQQVRDLVFSDPD